jgi:hypothetical protein
MVLERMATSTGLVDAVFEKRSMGTEPVAVNQTPGP